MQEQPYKLSCHCGAIRLEVDAPLEGLMECNCSTCRRAGYIHWQVPASSIKLVDEKRILSAYAWRLAAELQHFCPTCGTPVMRTWSSPTVQINARLIEETDVFELDVRRYDGRKKMKPGILP